MDTTSVYGSNNRAELNIAAARNTKRGDTRTFASATNSIRGNMGISGKKILEA